MSVIPTPNVSSMASDADSTTPAPKLKLNSGDVGWDYGMLSDPLNQEKWKCIKCAKEFSGGAYRIKLHIAGIKGQIVACTKASGEDKKRCKDALEGMKRKKKAARDTNEGTRSEVEVDKQEDIEDVEVGKSKRPPRTIGPMDRYVSNINPDDKCLTDSKIRRQQNINDANYKERRSLQVHQYMARWVYESGIPFHAVDNESFKRFVGAVGQFGPGYQPPRSGRNVIHVDGVREPEEDDFLSDGTEDEGDDDEECDFGAESDKEHAVEEIGNEEVKD